MMLLMLSSIYWCPWPCKSIIDATDVLFYAVVSAVAGVVIGVIVGHRLGLKAAQKIGMR